MKSGILGLALVASAFAAPASAQVSAEAAPVLAAMRAACGGDAWDRVQGWHETGTADVPGMPGLPYEIWHDMRLLKTAMINRVEGRTMRHAGFDGTHYWQAGPDGRVAVGADPAMVRRQRRDAYLSSFAWFFPARFPARIDLAAPQQVDGRAHDVLRIAPEAAEPFDLWVARGTHLVRRIVSGAEYADLTDYRTFGGVCSATTGRQGDGDPAHEIVLHVQTVDTTRRIGPETFAAPAGTAAPAPAH